MTTICPVTERFSAMAAAADEMMARRAELSAALKVLQWMEDAANLDEAFDEALYDALDDHADAWKRSTRATTAFFQAAEEWANARAKLQG